MPPVARLYLGERPCHALYERLEGGWPGDSGRGHAMKPVVNHTLCEGHARCEETVPQVFQVNDDDKSQVLVEAVPEELRDRVEVAVRVCPRQAISLEEGS